MDSKVNLGFCPKCKGEITKSHVNEDGVTIYVCDDCGLSTDKIVIPTYKIGEKVAWINPIKQTYESVTDYIKRSRIPRTITNILYTDGKTADDIVYELDNQSVAYGSELCKMQTKFKVELLCDDLHIIDSLREFADYLEETHAEGYIECTGDHYTADIKPIMC